ncbi:MAG: type II toxin-antitoxin system Phd/YefM family antitoxin [Deltaproteobacteria bacterium]|nr:type II toxin-antitoxin system Phd/YefM family antitoxin [Deltaproteobacteria bacterium]MBW1817852.1 type II toxin-antitoxin system Phd/YefM family antitoxin [Deltaproteobacteria bacterium]
MTDFQQIIPVTRMKRDLLDIVRRIMEEDETIAFTRNGEPAGVMMSMTRYESLLETIEVLADKDILNSLADSEKDFKAGRVFEHDEVWGER